MVVRACNPSTQALKQEVGEFKTCLSYSETLPQKTNKDIRHNPCIMVVKQQDR
jgi:hypothetical protein